MVPSLTRRATPIRSAIPLPYVEILGESGDSEELVRVFE